jgi:hypothetical protein
MNAQLRGFLQALQEHQHQLVMDYFVLSALGWVYWVKIRSVTLSAVLIHALAALSIFAVFAYISTIALYLLYPNYLDHIQATVASTSWLWMQGHELYPDWTTGEVYGSVYGPVLFLMNGVALLLLSPSILASKLPGVLSLGAALGASWMLLKWKTADSLTSLFLLASLVMLCGLFRHYAYWNRAEPFLILLNVLALSLAFRSSSLVAVIGIGGLTGVATGLKLHGFIYMIPAAAAAVARVKTLRGRLVMAIIGSACAVVFALLPYLEKGVSIIGYLRFLTVELDSGFGAHQLVENFSFAIILTAPIIVIWIGCKPALNSPDRWLLAALGPSVALITIPGAIEGAGTYHFLPLMPTCIYAIAVVCASSKIEAKGLAAFIFASVFLAYGPQLFLQLRLFRYLYQVATPLEHDKIAELKNYLDTYPEAQIGVTDLEHYPSYFYYVFSIWNGHPLDIDFTRWMGLAIGGVDEKYITRFVNGCTVPTWILPLGTPFTMLKWHPLLSEGFRATFATNYRQIDTGGAYQVWKCQLEPIPPVRTDHGPKGNLQK